MGSKYMIRWHSYPWDGCWQGEYQTEWFVKFAAKLLWAMAKYEIVDVNIRSKVVDA